MKIGQGRKVHLRAEELPGVHRRAREVCVMKNECMGGSGRRPVSVEESVKRWIHCSYCGKVVRIRPRTDKGTWRGHVGARCFTPLNK